ncbi:flagellar biosynthesis regulator FlaF [Stappia sp.]|jgi:flagellar protein FlaF|uniref:flagellar biosynthesis regulator FlaF n=1 Tax=Stappia sp. TaxID=1870903 RepID=UPI003A99D768
MHNLATAAYQQTSQKTANPRELEATLLLRAAARLQAVKDDWEADTPSSLDAALSYNRRLWTILATSVTSNDNPLPVEIKQNLGSLGAFIFKHTLDVMADPKPDRLTTLIQINRNIALGLRGN